MGTLKLADRLLPRSSVHFHTASVLSGPGSGIAMLPGKGSSPQLEESCRAQRCVPNPRCASNRLKPLKTCRSQV